MATVAQLEVVIDAKTKQFDQKMKQSSKGFEDLEKSAANFAKVAAGIFAAGGAISILKGMSEMAGRLEGIRQGFQKLNRPNLLANLRAATLGTVSDLKLMQAAVKADNFKIPLTQLATFFDFATKRATLTGESVDFLVESIVNGIGRKSALVLDNLGISLTELQKEIKITGDFATAAANIIEKEMGRMGNVTITTADKYAQLNTNIENVSANIGELINKDVPGLIGVLNNLLVVLDAAVTAFGEIKDFGADLVPENHPIVVLANRIIEAWGGVARAILKARGTVPGFTPLVGGDVTAEAGNLQAREKGLRDIGLIQSVVKDTIGLTFGSRLNAPSLSGTGPTPQIPFGVFQGGFNQDIRRLEAPGLGDGSIGITEEMMKSTEELIEWTDILNRSKIEKLKESEATAEMGFIAGTVTSALVGLVTGVLSAEDALKNLALSIFSGILTKGITNAVFGLPFFDVGTPFVPQDMVAVVHKGEAIVPANMNPFGKGGGGGIGGGGRIELFAHGAELRGVINEWDSMRGTQS